MYQLEKCIANSRKYYNIGLLVKNPYRLSNTLPNVVIEKHRTSILNKNRVEKVKKDFSPPPENYRELYPDFLPNPDRRRRDKLAEMLERQDMLKRRSVIDIPEFYVGSIMSVTVMDVHASNKENKFVGICIQRTGIGLRANFTLRNIVDGQGVEITYDLYCPLILRIETLRLEKRLDEELFYLRDAPQEYSTFAFDMLPIQHPPNEPVPINQLKVKLNPKPWHERWERKSLKGIQELVLSQKALEKAKNPAITKPWEKFDLMKKYRERINDVEAEAVMSEVFAEISKIEKNKNISFKSKTTATFESMKSE